MYIRSLLLLFISFSLSNCASILSGTSQTLSVQSIPPGASCDVSRNGAVIASIPQTPGGTLIKKTKDDINLLCKKQNFQDASVHLDSKLDTMTIWNILLGGFIGWGFDSALGADNKYDENTTVALIPVGNQPSSISASTTPVANKEIVSDRNTGKIGPQSAVTNKQAKCSTEQILKMKSIDLSDDQIKSSCD